MRLPFATVSLLAALALGGCAAYPQGVEAPPSAAAGGLLVADLGQGAGQATVRLPRRGAAPAKPTYLYVSTGWTADDVYEYRLRLQRRVGDAFEDVAPAIGLTLPVQGAAAGARFTGLAAGEVYRIALETWGCEGGTSPSYRLDAAQPAFSDPIDFTGENDIEQEVPVSIQPVLD